MFFFYLLKVNLAKSIKKDVWRFLDGVLQV